MVSLSWRRGQAKSGLLIFPPRQPAPLLFPILPAGNLRKRKRALRLLACARLRGSRNRNIFFPSGFPSLYHQNNDKYCKRRKPENVWQNVYLLLCDHWQISKQRLDYKKKQGGEPCLFLGYFRFYLRIRASSATTNKPKLIIRFARSNQLGFSFCSAISFLLMV